MPELPEVETVKRGLAPFMEGARVARLQLNRGGLRFPFSPLLEKANGAVIEKIERRAKYLLMRLDNGFTLLSHLGMSGSFRIEEAVLGEFHHARHRLAAHDHVIFHFEKGKVIYNDPRRFGFFEIFESEKSHKMLENLGVEPFSNHFSAKTLLTEKSTPLKSYLLNQEVVAGLGNIYVCEALFKAGLSPFAKAFSLTEKPASLLVKHIRETLIEAIEAGGSSLNDHAQVSGELGYFQHRFKVYDREGEPCLICKSAIKREKQAGRSTFYCAECQPFSDQS